MPILRFLGRGECIAEVFPKIFCWVHHIKILLLTKSCLRNFCVNSPPNAKFITGNFIQWKNEFRLRLFFLETKDGKKN